MMRTHPSAAALIKQEVTMTEVRGGQGQAAGTEVAGFGSPRRFQGTDAFRREESVGQELFSTLTGRQRRLTVIAGELPQDLFAGAFRDNLEVGYAGLPFGQLTKDQRAIAAELLGLYTGRANPGHAAVRADEVRAHEDETCFAWIGDPEGVFCYRVHSPVILIEFEHQHGVMFDNDEPTRQHIHTVVRTPNGNDYGRDLLRQHYAQHGHGAAAAHAHAHAAGIPHRHA
jgi:hypothetical protein